MLSDLRQGISHTGGQDSWLEFVIDKQTDSLTLEHNMNEYKNFTDAELIRAVELMVSVDDLGIREVDEAILAVFGYSSEEVREQLDSGECLNDRPLRIIA